MTDHYWFLRPTSIFRAGVVFLHDWWFSRSFLSLLRGLPAVLVILTVAGFLLTNASETDAELTRRYDDAARAALEEDDYDAAQVYYDKLVRLDPSEPKYKFALALLAERQDDIERARRLMAQLAPLERTAYGPAHFWLANDRLKQEKKTDDDLQFAQTQMLRAVDAEPNNLRAHAVLSQLYALKNDVRRAADHLEQVVVRQPSARMGLALLYAQLGKSEEATAQARLYADYCADRLRKTPADDNLRISLARAEALLNNHKQAVKILRQGMALSKDARLPQMLATVLASWSDRLPKEQLSDKLELIQQAVTLAPDNPAVLQRLAPFALEENAESEQIRKQLHDILASGKAQAAIHMILGTIATQENDLENAVLHLEQAYRQNPRMPSVANNLAWVLAHRDPPQLDRALKLANAAVKLAPRNAQIYETRGVIHIKLMNWKDAVTDLEMALPGLQSAQQKRAVHKNLALAYENLGENQLANKHRELSIERAAQSDHPNR